MDIKSVLRSWLLRLYPEFRGKLTFDEDVIYVEISARDVEGPLPPYEMREIFHEWGFRGHFENLKREYPLIESYEVRYANELFVVSLFMKPSQIKKAAVENFEDIDTVPPQNVANSAKRGLELRRMQTGDKAGLTNEEAANLGIGSGVQRAVNLKNRDRLSIDTIKMMWGFFRRFNKHITKARKLSELEEILDSNMYISDLLWGGKPGEEWVNEVMKQIRKVENKKDAGMKDTLIKIGSQVPSLRSDIRNVLAKGSVNEMLYGNYIHRLFHMNAEELFAELRSLMQMSRWESYEMRLLQYILQIAHQKGPRFYNPMKNYVTPERVMQKRKKETQAIFKRLIRVNVELVYAGIRMKTEDALPPSERVRPHPIRFYEDVGEWAKASLKAKAETDIKELAWFFADPDWEKERDALIKGALEAEIEFDLDLRGRTRRPLNMQSRREGEKVLKDYFSESRIRNLTRDNVINFENKHLTPDVLNWLKSVVAEDWEWILAQGDKRWRSVKNAGDSRNILADETESVFGQVRSLMQKPKWTQTEFEFLLYLLEKAPKEEHSALLAYVDPVKVAFKYETSLKKASQALLSGIVPDIYLDTLDAYQQSPESWERVRDKSIVTSLNQKQSFNYGVDRSRSYTRPLDIKSKREGKALLKGYFSSNNVYAYWKHEQENDGGFHDAMAYYPRELQEWATGAVMEDLVFLIRNALFGEVKR